MKMYPFAIIILFLASCNTDITKVLDTSKNKSYDDTSLLAVKMIEPSKLNFTDTAGLYLSPVKIQSNKLVKKEYSDYRNISITFKNVGKKDISAIRFRWCIINAFGELADRGYGNGANDIKLRVGKSNSSEWSLLSRDAKKIVSAWPTEIVFEDGTKWEINK